MKIELTNNQIVSIHAALHCLYESREYKRDAVFYANIRDNNAPTIPFQTAAKHLAYLLEYLHEIGVYMDERNNHNTSNTANKPIK